MGRNALPPEEHERITERFLLQTTQRGKEWSEIFKLLKDRKERKKQPVIICPVKLSLKSK